MIEILSTGVRVELAASYNVLDDEPIRAAPSDQQVDRNASSVPVRATAFIEFRSPEGTERWEGTPQGPFCVSTRESATKPLFEMTADVFDRASLNAELGIAGYRHTRFAYAAAPRRIDLDERLASALVLT